MSGAGKGAVFVARARARTDLRPLLFRCLGHGPGFCSAPVSAPWCKAPNLAAAPDGWPNFTEIRQKK